MKLSDVYNHDTDFILVWDDNHYQVTTVVLTPVLGRMVYGVRISGEPGYWYATDESSMTRTTDSMYRLQVWRSALDVQAKEIEVAFGRLLAYDDIPQDVEAA